MANTGNSSAGMLGLGLRARIFGLGLEAQRLHSDLGIAARNLSLPRPRCVIHDLLQQLSKNFLQKTIYHFIMVHMLRNEIR